MMKGLVVHSVHSSESPVIVTLAEQKVFRSSCISVGALEYIRLKSLLNHGEDEDLRDHTQYEDAVRDE